jgi:hypothetical protein
VPNAEQITGFRTAMVSTTALKLPKKGIPMRVLSTEVGGVGGGEEEEEERDV